MYFSPFQPRMSAPSSEQQPSQFIGASGGGGGQADHSHITSTTIKSHLNSSTDNSKELFLYFLINHLFLMIFIP